MSWFGKVVDINDVDFIKNKPGTARRLNLHDTVIHRRYSSFKLRAVV
jgi:hypothetical protein